MIRSGETEVKKYVTRFVSKRLFHAVEYVLISGFRAVLRKFISQGFHDDLLFVFDHHYHVCMPFLQLDVIISIHDSLVYFHPRRLKTRKLSKKLSISSDIVIFITGFWVPVAKFKFSCLHLVSLVAKERFFHSKLQADAALKIFKKLISKLCFTISEKGTHHVLCRSNSLWNKKKFRWTIVGRVPNFNSNYAFRIYQQNCN